MTKTREAPETNDETPTVDVPADSFIEVVAGQVATLHGLSLSLESSMSQSICTCEPLGEAQIQMLQRVDFLRQSLKDIDAILQYVGPLVSWKSGPNPSAIPLVHAVEMRESLKGIVDTTPDTKPAAPTEAGTLDLWT